MLWNISLSQLIYIYIYIYIYVYMQAVQKSISLFQIPSMNLTLNKMKYANRIVTNISSFRVNTTSTYRRRIKQPEVSFSSIFLLFFFESSWGSHPQQTGKISSPRLLMIALCKALLIKQNNNLMNWMILLLFVNSQYLE